MPTDPLRKEQRVNIELKAADGGMVQVSPEILQSFKAGFRGPVLAPDAPTTTTRAPSGTR